MSATGLQHQGVDGRGEEAGAISEGAMSEESESLKGPEEQEDQRGEHPKLVFTTNRKRGNGNGLIRAWWATSASVQPRLAFNATTTMERDDSRQSWGSGP